MTDNPLDPCEGDCTDCNAECDERREACQQFTEEDTKLDAALKYAARGYSVFPCKPGGKKPLGKLAPNGCKDATTDVDVIRKWWTKSPDANIGIECTDMIVIDVDLDDDGRNDWPQLMNLELEDAIVQQTPSGGTHFIFARPLGRHWRPSAKKVAPKIDTRTDDSYIMVEPSTIGDSSYTLEAPLPPKDELPACPQWLADILDLTFPPPPAPKPAPKPRKAAPVPISCDVIERAERYVELIDDAVSGEAGSVPTFRCASTLVNGYRLDPDTALDIMLRVYNEKCSPAWTEKELRHKIEDATAKGCGPNGERPGWLLDAPRDEAIDPTTLTVDDCDTPIGFHEMHVPTFPVDALGDILGPYAAALAEETQTPVDLPALGVLATTSACLARHVIVSNGAHEEPTNLYTMAALPPESRKSAVFEKVTRPLREVEADEIEAQRSIVAAAESERRILEAQLRKAETAAANSGMSSDRQNALDLARQLEEMPRIYLPRRIVDDTTTEQLEVILYEQGGRIMAASSEGVMLDNVLGRYSSGQTDAKVYLAAWNDADIRTDRLTRSTVKIERPRLTCFYAIQPEVIRKALGRNELSGRGFLARFLYAYPKSTKRRCRPPVQRVARRTRSDAAPRPGRAAPGNVALEATRADSQDCRRVALRDRWRRSPQRSHDDGSDRHSSLVHPSRRQDALVSIRQR